MHLTSRYRPRALLLQIALLSLLPACRSSRPKPSAGSLPSTVCPDEIPAPAALPWSRPMHTLAELWIARASGANAVLLAPRAIAAHNRRVERLRDEGWPVGRWRLLQRPVDRRAIRRRDAQTLDRLQRKIVAGTRVFADGSRPTKLVESLRLKLRAARPADELRVVRRSTPLRCYPVREALFASIDENAFDLLQCAQLHYGEPVRVLAKGAQMWHVWSSYSSGWVDPAALSSALTAEQARAYVEPPRFAVVAADAVGVWSTAAGGALLGVARLGLHLPLVGGETPPSGPLAVRAPGRQGLVRGWIRRRAAATVGHTPLTRAALWRRALALVNTPYGWGGMGEHRDCSRLLMDLFQSFGLRLPRNSRQQSRAGVRQVDVHRLGDRAKAAAIERAARDALVLLYMPGHIMLFLGRDGGHLFALHQFSGYLVPCPGGGETMRRVNRAAVTSLELGRGTTRRAFIQRITRLVLIAPPT